MELLCERARSTDSSFELSEHNADGVAEICRRLDGIPLAIECAAARLEMLSVNQIADRIGDHFRLLTERHRAALARHQTLHAALTWSFALLTPREQLGLARLSVFAGGWTPEAAEVICADDALPPVEVLPALSGLVAKSLVQVERFHHEVRHRHLETVREFAAERLAELGGERDLRARHGDWYAQLVAATAEHLQKPDGDVWLDGLDV